MSLGMQSLELFSRLVEFDLRGLRLGDLLLEFFGLAGDFDGKFLDVEGQLLDLGLIGSPVLLQREVVLLLLPGSERPLLELLLIPIHLQLELIHLLVCLEYHILYVIKSVLLVGNSLFKFLNLVLEASTLPLSHLFQVLLGLNLLVFDVHEGLSVHELHLHGLQVLVQDLQTLLVLLDLQT